MAALALIVGLGNPGAEYEATRHNAGFWFVDVLADRAGVAFRKEARFNAALARGRIGEHDVRLLKPLTYMNDSGRAVASAMKYFDIGVDELLVAHDELDLPPGVARLKTGGGAGGHNGLRDIIAVLGTQQYQRLRLGIGRPPGGGDVTNYVLGRPSRTDRDLIDAAIGRSADLAYLVAAGSTQQAMNELHRDGAAG
ncbi:MAG: aminoacyl-tRNA hydrolase [Gammaproteobacteria bacterium]